MERSFETWNIFESLSNYLFIVGNENCSEEENVTRF